MAYRVKRLKGTKARALPKALRGVRFMDYETARSAVRRYIRTTGGYDSSFESIVSYNPPINAYGFTVVRG